MNEVCRYIVKAAKAMILAANGSIEKNKAKFVARGFSLLEGVDYKDIFALVSDG